MVRPATALFLVATSLMAASACTTDPPVMTPATIATVAPPPAGGRPLAVSPGAPTPELAAVTGTGPATLVETSGDVPIYSDDPHWGDRTSPALVVFVDLQCPHCAVFHKMLVDAARPRSVRVVWKHFPLRSHPAARPAAEAAQGVFMMAGGDAFTRFVERVFEANSKGKGLTPDDFARWAGEAGVRDLSDYRTGLTDGRWASTVDRDLALTEKLHLEGTPTLFIDGTLFNGSDDLATAITRRP